MCNVRRFRPRIKSLILPVSVVSAMVVSGNSIGQVSPDTVDLILAPGESSDPITKTITIPPIPTSVEICLVVDISGSFSDDLVTLQDPATTSAITSIVSSADTATFGLASYSDYPVSPFGSSSDIPYQLNTALTNEADWTTAVQSLSTLFGGDGPESQLDAIVGAAVGLAGWGESCGWSDTGATQIIIATTDASCHETDGTHLNSTTDVINTLTANDITFIGLASGATAQACFQPIADGTGGVVEDLNSDGSNITSAIEQAIDSISYDIVPVADSCPELTVAFDPIGYFGVSPGDVLTFSETITYIGTGADVSCEVPFGPAGVQTINVSADGGTGDGGEGCTPGYWKQKHHFSDWTSYATGQSFRSVFGVGPNRSLLSTMKRGGGKFNALGRHAVAALLNASSTDVSYDYTEAEVIQIVNDAYSSGNWRSAKNLLESSNESGCPL